MRVPGQGALSSEKSELSTSGTHIELAASKFYILAITGVFTMHIRPININT